MSPPNCNCYFKSELINHVQPARNKNLSRVFLLRPADWFTAKRGQWRQTALRLTSAKSQTQTSFWGRRFELGHLKSTPLPYCKQYANSLSIQSLWFGPQALNTLFPIPRGFRSPVGYTEHISPPGDLEWGWQCTLEYTRPSKTFESGLWLSKVHFPGEDQGLWQYTKLYSFPHRLQISIVHSHHAASLDEQYCRPVIARDNLPWSPCHAWWKSSIAIQKRGASVFWLSTQ